MQILAGSVISLTNTDTTGIYQLLAMYRMNHCQVTDLQLKYAPNKINVINESGALVHQ